MLLDITFSVVSTILKSFSDFNLYPLNICPPGMLVLPTVIIYSSEIRLTLSSDRLGFSWLSDTSSPPQSIR